MLPAVLVLRVILPNFQIGSYKVMGDLGRGIDSTSLYGVCSFAQDFYIGKTGWHESHSHSRRAERGKRVTEAHCTALAQPWHSDGSAAFPPSSPCCMGALRQLSLAPHLSHKLLPK